MSLVSILWIFLSLKIWPMHGNGVQPNMIVFIADDAGWNDFGIQGGSEILTPNIDSLAKQQGMILDKFYVQSTCTPTRAAFFTGRYPLRYGFQSGALSPMRPYGLSISEILISDELLKATPKSYRNHYIGKWHLGHCAKVYTPLMRGFHTFYGSWTGTIDKITKQRKYQATDGHMYYGYDLRDGYDEAVIESGKVYTTELYQERAISIIEDYSDAVDNGSDPDPFFMVVSFEVPHAPMKKNNDFLNMYRDARTKDAQRIGYMTMVSGMDHAIGQVAERLKDLRLWDDTLIVFFSDNGGLLWKAKSSNWPLRGAKGSLFEGGLRSFAFFSGGWLHVDSRRKRFDEYLHVTDLYQTLLDVGGIETPTRPLDKLDGIDFSRIIKYGLGNTAYRHKRTEILLNLDSERGFCKTVWGKRLLLCGGIIKDGWKLVIGNVFHLNSPEEEYSGWIRPDVIPFRGSRISIDCFKYGRTGPPVLSNDFVANTAPYNGKPALFNLNEDPCEFTDVSDRFPTKVENLIDALVRYQRLWTHSMNREIEEDDVVWADPKNDYLGGYFGVWRGIKQDHMGALEFGYC